MTEQRWSEAASYLDSYVNQIDDDWEAHFSRGVAHANTRSGVDSNRASLRAYDDAIALLPDDAPKHLVARLYGYRGAIKKRLGRLDEAEVDLRLARRLADTPYEVLDTTYNLACVMAMKNDRAASIHELYRLRDLGGINLVRGHLHDYFVNLRDDEEFRQLVGL